VAPSGSVKVIEVGVPPYVTESRSLQCSRSVRTDFGPIIADVSVAFLVGGATYASASNVSASSTDPTVHTTATLPMPVVGAVSTNFMSEPLLAGTYVLSVGGDLVDSQPSDFSNCFLAVGGKVVVTHGTRVGDPNMPTSGSSPRYLETVSITGKAVVGHCGATAVFGCSHDRTNRAASYLDAGAFMVAHRTNCQTVATNAHGRDEPVCG
jgi:hypothetical protein